MTGAQTHLGLSHTGTGILLEQSVRMRAPAPALADKRDLTHALARHHGLDDVAEQSDRGACRVAQRGPLVAQDAGIAVLVGADRVPDSEVGQEAREDRHGMFGPRILRIGLDPRKAGFGACAFHLEFRHEHGGLAAGAFGVDHRPLVRKEPEAGEVLDIRGVEEDVAGKAITPDVVEQPFATLAQLHG